MSGANKDELISVFVDGREVRVAPGTNMVEAAAQAGVEVPHYCYHPKLSVVGNCRMCLVEMGLPGVDRATGKPILDEDGQQKTMWMPRPAIACATNAVPGLHIRTDSKVVEECRQGVMEFLLINHPLDCPICDQAGECRLQEFATDYGRGFSRFIEPKNVKPKRTRLGPRVVLDDERCILCSRCIRFCQEVADDDVLGFTDRGSTSTLTCFPGRELANNYSLNTVDICPVGALTSTDFRFRMRVWFLRETPSICAESSAGVNTTVATREGEIYRITPRRNDAVNDTWMPDSGRLLYREVRAENRLTGYAVDGDSVLAETAEMVAAELLRSAEGVAFVGSGRASVEEQFILKKVADATGARVDLVARTGEGDGLLLSADRNPNVRGALVTGLVDELPRAELGLAARIAAGEVSVVFSHGEDLTAAGVAEDLLARVAVVYLGTHDNPTSRSARVVLPGLTVFEKSGSFINQQFRLQKFAQAVPGLAGVYPDVQVLSMLGAMLGGGFKVAHGPAEVWAAMAAEVAAFEGLDFARIPAEGLPLDPSPWAGLPFVEGAGLHFDPAVAPAAAAAR